MVGVELGACEWFVWDLRRSNLIERGQLDQIVGEFLEQNPKAEPPQLAEYFVQQHILTRFQADNLLAGKNQGLVLGPYVLLDALGSGSMGTVYQARSKNNDHLYAVKVLPRRSMWNVRIARRRVRDFEQFQHPAVVPFVDVGTAGGMHYLAWPLVEGVPLERLVKEQGKLTPANAAMVALQTAEGLEACHSRDIFHGLLKPSNLLMAPERQVKILDLGVGALLSQTEGESVVDTMSTANTMVSGLDCASPESILDPAAMGPASDQYSLGCVLYFCLTGDYPFPSGNAVEKMMAHQTKQPTPIRELSPDVPEDLVRVVDRLMQKTPASRYVSMSDVVSALRPFARDASLVAPSVAPSPRAPHPVSKQAATPVPPIRKPDDPVARPARPTPTPMKASPASGVPAASKPTAAPSARLASTNPLAAPPSPFPAASKPTRPQPPPYVPDTGRGPEDRLGTMGIAVVALVCCATAFLVAYLLQ